MGEIIRRPLPARPMPFTGERLTSDYGGQTEIEHLHRYLLAREFCRGKDVLDIASGEGYGSALLSQVARSVLGIDISDQAVAHSGESYGSGNLSFRQGDAQQIPAEDASVDVVVSFETIEHFLGQEQFVREVRRVLRPDGVFVVSTPDRDQYSYAETPANPYHARELTVAEFRALLGGSFAHLALLMQRPVWGSVMLPAEPNGQDAICFERRGAEHFEASRNLPRPVYAIAVASAQPIALAPASVYIETSRLGVLRPEEAVERQRQLEQQLEAERAGQNERIRVLGEELDRARRDAFESGLAQGLGEGGSQISSLKAEIQALLAANEMSERACTVLKSELQGATQGVAQAEQRLEAAGRDLTRTAASLSELATERDRLTAQLSYAESVIRMLQSSSSWRVTRPLRALGRVVRARPGVV